MVYRAVCMAVCRPAHFLGCLRHKPVLSCKAIGFLTVMYLRRTRYSEHCTTPTWLCGFWTFLELANYLDQMCSFLHLALHKQNKLMAGILVWDFD